MTAEELMLQDAMLDQPEPTYEFSDWVYSLFNSQPNPTRR